MCASSKDEFNAIKERFVSQDAKRPILFECFTREEDERNARDFIDSIDDRVDSKTRIKKIAKTILPKTVIDSLKAIRH